MVPPQLIRVLAWFRRLGQFGRRSSIERGMDDEFRFHIDSYAADLRNHGAERIAPDE